MGAFQRLTHLLLFDHSLADNWVDRRRDECRGDRLIYEVPISIIGEQPFIPFDISRWGQFKQIPNDR